MPLLPGDESQAYEVFGDGCEEWCATHDDPVSGRDDGCCRSQLVEVGDHELFLEREHSQTVVRVSGNRPGEWLELDDAPWLTQLMSSLLDAATSPAPAEHETVGVVAGLMGTTRQRLAARLGVDLDKASMRQAQRMAGVLALHGVAISES